MIAALFQHLRDNVLLADMRFGDVLDHDPCRGGDGCGAVPHAIPQRHRELWVVEDADPVGMKEPRHAIRVADARQRSGNHHSVEAGQNPGDLLTVALNQRLAHTSPCHPDIRATAYNKLVGSGSAGLGLREPRPRA